MNLFSSPDEMSAFVAGRRRAGRRQVLVPTMGALHDGHIQLVREGLKHGDDVTVSVFVNPTQFSVGEDYGRYPRDVDDDLRQLKEVNDGITVFVPQVDAMYPGGKDVNRTWVEVEDLDRHLCGRHRPGHFRGVTTIVARLFNICRPDAAIFGLKDAQQFVILNRMVRDLHFGIEMIGVETIREEDGLALSSRNVFLNEKERSHAAALSKAVKGAERLVKEGERRTGVLTEAMRSALAERALVRTQYAEVVDAETLQPIERIEPGQDILAAVAAYLGETRLIDSVFVRATDRHGPIEE